MTRHFSKDNIDLRRRRVVSINEQGNALLFRVHLSNMLVETGAVNQSGRPGPFPYDLSETMPGEGPVRTPAQPEVGIGRVSKT